MNRKELILVGLAPAIGTFHSPVQVQKLFFLIDRNLADALNGPFFNFQPYNYGPFDKNVYEILEELTREGLIEIDSSRTWKEYRLTEKGQSEGNLLLESLPKKVNDYICQASDFVRKLSFTQLISSIYKAYPEMKANSVFQG